MEKNLAISDPTILKLIYLWAFIEGGLGGFLHLFHIPLTGFMIGGFSIFINILLAKHSQTNAKIMLAGLGLVLVSKFTLSPYSPIGAYIAVSFQGIVAILIFKQFRINRYSIALYANLVMLENAVQKPFIAYMVFGSEVADGILWIANQVFKNSSLTDTFIYGLVLLYFAIYIIWACTVANISWQFLNKLYTYTLPADFNDISLIPLEKPSIKNKILIPFLLLGLILTVFIYLYSTNQNVLRYAMKIAFTFLLLGFILPVLLKTLLSHFQQKNESKIADIRNELPRIKEFFLQSYRYSSQFHGLKRWKEFVFLSVYLSIFFESNDK